MNAATRKHLPIAAMATLAAVWGVCAPALRVHIVLDEQTAAAKAVQVSLHADWNGNAPQGEQPDPRFEQGVTTDGEAPAPCLRLEAGVDTPKLGAPPPLLSPAESLLAAASPSPNACQAPRPTDVRSAARTRPHLSSGASRAPPLA